MTTRRRFLEEYSKALSDDQAAIFIGAGVSTGAGYPTWRQLLQDIGDELGVATDDIHDLAALAQWSVRKSAGKTRVLNVIRDQIKPDKKVPPALEVVARLPLRNIWTTNYDRLIERAFEAISRPLEAVSGGADLTIRPRPGAARLLKMHGTIDRLNDIVIATDDYELYRVNRGAFLPLLQAHMTSFSMLFVGLSFTDPNVRHVLSLIRESFTQNPPEHFAIVRPPQRADFKTKKEFDARYIQHKHWADDLLRYGLHVVEVSSYREIDELLLEVERRVANNRVWISGSWPVTGLDPHQTEFNIAVARAIGYRLGVAGFALLNGSGLTIGPATISGFLDALQKTGSWDLERRLLVRPFPQPLEGREPNRTQWTSLRSEMARVSGTLVILGGKKLVDGSPLDAAGVLEEFRVAVDKGSLIVPVGSTGGAAAAIAKELAGRANPSDQRSRVRKPSNADLRRLTTLRDPEEAAELVLDIITRHASGKT